MIIFIKGMVCQRCIMVVGQLLERIGIEAMKVDLGRIDLYDVPTSEQMQALDRGLKELGFELVFDKRPQLIEAIKLATIDYVYANPPSARTSPTTSSTRSTTTTTTSATSSPQPKASRWVNTP